MYYAVMMLLLCKIWWRGHISANSLNYCQFKFSAKHFDHGMYTECMSNLIIVLSRRDLDACVCIYVALRIILAVISNKHFQTFIIWPGAAESKMKDHDRQGRLFTVRQSQCRQGIRPIIRLWSFAHWLCSHSSCPAVGWTNSCTEWSRFAFVLSKDPTLLRGETVWWTKSNFLG